MNWLQKIRMSFARSMQGRYGADRLSRALIYFALALVLAGMFTKFSIFSWIAFLVLIWGYFRIFSRNFSARRRENDAYLRLTFPLRSAISAHRDGKRDGANLYFCCPNCHVQLRVPRGKGKLRVTCPKCGRQFTKNSK